MTCCRVRDRQLAASPNPGGQDLSAPDRCEHLHQPRPASLPQFCRQILGPALLASKLVLQVGEPMLPCRSTFLSTPKLDTKLRDFLLQFGRDRLPACRLIRAGTRAGTFLDTCRDQFCVIW
jgi:hypothetical protein